MPSADVFQSISMQSMQSMLFASLCEKMSIDSIDHPRQHSHILLRDDIDACCQKLKANEEHLVAKRLKSAGADLQSVWGGTLYMPEDQTFYFSVSNILK